MFPEVRRVLAEFGDLKFGKSNDYVRIAPSEAKNVVEEIRRYEALIGRRLYPLGVMEHQDRHYLVLDENGIVYTLIDELEPLASSFERAIEFLIWPHSSRREMEADLEQVGMLGKTWRLG